MNADEDSLEEDDMEEEDEDGEEEDDDDDDDKEEELEDDPEEEEPKWKRNLLETARLNFEKRKTTVINWYNLIYGKEKKSHPYDNLKSNTQNQDQEKEEPENDGFFKIKKTNSKTNSFKTDNSKYELNLKSKNQIETDKLSDVFEAIKDCFVTGKWEKNKDAANLLADDEDVESAFGDFEDLEGDDGFGDDLEDDEKEDFDDDDESDHDEDGPDKGGDEEQAPKAKKRTRNDLTKNERLRAKKRRLKERFDAEFDDGKDGAEKIDAFYDSLNQQASKQSELNRLEFDKLDDTSRVEYEGFRCGMYVRVEINNMPCELVDKFDAKYLTILGSLVTNEANIGYVQVRIKKHRWYKKILKTKNPLIVSLGWRRFQTIPIYFIQDHNMRNRYLKYTPQHMFCHASFWGPITPPNTGFLAFESLSSDIKDFRIAATGVVVDANKSTQIVKKLKLIGRPLKIFRKTAFVQVN